MCVKGQRSWIFVSDNRTRQSKDGEREGSESSGLASAEKYKRCAEVFGVDKLLQTVCQRSYKGSKISS